MTRDGFIVARSVDSNKGILSGCWQAGRAQIPDMKWGHHYARSIRSVLIMFSTTRESRLDVDAFKFLVLCPKLLPSGLSTALTAPRIRVPYEYRLGTLQSKVK